MNPIAKAVTDILKDKELFLLDMDGTLYLGNKLFPDTIAFLEAIKKSGKRYLFVTNNSSKSVSTYMKKLAGMGIEADKNDFFTSSMLTITYIKEHYPKAVVYCMGTQSLIDELKASGIKIDPHPSDKTSLVLLGYDTELTYEKLIDVVQLLARDIPYLATNPDYVCPAETGYLPDCGAMAQMLEHATGKLPYFLGKPNPEFLLAATRFAGSKPDKAIVVGDRLYTDIQGGINTKIATICVLSGETGRETLAASDIRPDLVLDSIADIARYL